MSSDERYLYHQPGINTNYGYSSYPHPPPSYDNQPVVHPPLRPMRSSSSSQSQPHSPPQPPSSHYQPPPTSYPPNYGQGHYMPQHVPNQPPPQPPQWPNENWHYNQSYPPPLPHPPHPSSVEPPFNSGPGRPEPMHSSPMEPPRGYSNAPPSNVDSHRIDDRQSSSLAPPPPLSSTQPQPSSQAKSRRREKESPPAITNSGPSTGLDFIKLLESYRTIIDGSEMFIGRPGMPSAQSRPAPSAETMERMLQSATYGAQVLEAASMQNSVPVAESKSPKEKETDESKDSANGSSASTKRQKPDDTVQEGQTCLGCGATSTPEWRRGPMGPRTLCNACGLVYAKLIKKRVREKFGSQKKTNGQGGTSSQGQGEESGEGDSDDDDEYGSQDRRSEGVDMGRD